MDSITLPKIHHLGNRHYRVNPPRHTQSDSLLAPIGQLEELSINDAAYSPTETSDTENFDILETDGAEFVAHITIPAVFHRHIIGPNRTQLNKIERDLRCTVTLPQNGGEYSEFIIKSSSKVAVRDACRRMLWIQSNVRSQMKPTHFVCLPANQVDIQKNFQQFRQSVLASAKNSSNSDFRGVNENIFHSPSGLHFTLVPLLLADSTEVARACQLLNELLQSPLGLEVFSGGPLCLSIKGLEYMNDDPTAVNVLYAKIAPSADAQRLQRMADTIFKMFLEHNFVSGRHSFQTDTVLLHMTLINSRFGHSIDGGGSEPFSVVGILREFGDFMFAADIPFDEFHLSVMRSQSEHAFFAQCCSIQLMASGPKLVVTHDVPVS